METDTAQVAGDLATQLTTAQEIADKVSTQLMLRYLYEILGSLDDNPDAFRAAARTQLQELAMTVPLGPISPKMEKDVRRFARENIGTLLTNKAPH